MTRGYSPAKQSVLTWDQFSKMFCGEYVPLVERGGVAQEYMLLRKRTKSVTEITRMLHKRSLFFPRYASSK